MVHLVPEVAGLQRMECAEGPIDEAVEVGLVADDRFDVALARDDDGALRGSDDVLARFPVG